PAAAELVLARAGGRTTRSFPATVTRDGAGLAEVRGEVPLEALAATPERPAGTGPGLRDDTVSWDLYVKPAGQGRIPVTFPEEVAEARQRHAGREIAVERARYGTVALAERAPRPVIDSHAWGSDGTLELRGSYLGNPGTGLAAV